MQFKLCENTGFFLRMGLVGPSGSGKTYTALKIATELGPEKIGILDTENRSARRYAKMFGKRFQSLELSTFSPKDYIEAIHAAEAAGIEVLVIDSLSHAWMGKGGVLEMVDQSARRQSRGGSPNSFSGWREVTPEHNKLVDALVHAQLHLIVTMRVKTEYVIEKDDKGKSVPRKVGLAPVQRDGLEYEFDIVGDLSAEHDLLIAKSRCPALSDAIIQRPGVELARSLRAWLEGVDAVAAPSAESAETDPETHYPTHADLPPVRPVAPRLRAMQADAGGDELGAIIPWLKRIQEAEEGGSEEQLDAVREEMNVTLKKRTRLQGEALRRAIETARAAIRATQQAAPAEPLLPDVATATG